MKRAAFIFFVILLSGITIIGTLKTYKANSVEASKKDMKAFLEMKTGLFSYDVDKKDFSGTDKNSKYLYHRLSPIDGIYYTSNSKNAVKITKSGPKTIIAIGEGEYVFNLNDIFEKYEIQADNFRINQLGKGVFFVNNIAGDYKVYSFNSLLRLDLISDTASKSKVTFDLFPSLLFKYNPELNKNLLSIEYDEKTKKNVEKSSDVLRISQIDSIYYVDSKSDKFLSYIFIKPTAKNIVDMATKDIKSKIEKHSELYTYLIEMNIESIPGTELTKDYSGLFQNQTKKTVYLRNELAKNFIEVLKNSGDKTKAISIQANILLINDILSQMQGISDEFYKEGVGIIKNYYYISYFGNIFDSNGNADFAQSGIGSGMKSIFKDKIAGEDYFGALSDIFFTYQFSDSSKDILDSNIDKYLGGLIENKLLRNEDFLNFSFFLTQYSLSLTNITKSNLNIVNYLISLFQNYYMTIIFSDKTKEGEKKFSTLSIQFYSLTKIINKINNSILTNYFENKNKIIQLKPKYTIQSGDSFAVNIPQEILIGLVSVYKIGSKDMQNKETDFKNFLSKQGKQISGVKSNYTLLEEQYKKLNFINENMLLNYSDWQKKQNLSSEFRNAKEEVYKDTLILTKEDLVTYLNKFNGIDISSLKIDNESTMSKDGYYKVEVLINNSKYSFKMFPENHKITETEITDLTNGSKKQYGSSILLDSKEDAYRDSYASAATPADKRKFDFKNFLINMSGIGTEDTTAADVPLTTPTKPVESKFISLFKQNKLIEGDFTFVKKFIEIPYTAINAKIVNDEYVIDIIDAKKDLSNGDYNLSIELSSSYNFASKQFENISVKLLRTPLNEEDPYELGGNSISISPAKIGLKEFSAKMANLGDYVNMIKSKYFNGKSNMKIDLNSSKVYIDSTSFPVK